MIDSQRWRILEPLLDTALALPDLARGAWLAELRSRTPELASDLTSLLASEALAEERGFLTHSPSTSFPLSGLSVGTYVLERPIGHGGTSSVWLARAGHTGAPPVAIKLLNVSLRGSVAEERFQQEGEVLRRLAHPGIRCLLDTGVTPDGQLYLVLELVDGQPIDEFAIERGLSIRERVALVRQVLAAVAHAHANHIVHRDLKPSNILVAGSGVAKVLDFGIAKLLDSTGAQRRLTDRGGRALTPEFTTPEQVSGGAITTATDTYALGVVLYLMATGRHPTAARTRGVRDVVETFTALLEMVPAPAGLGDLDPILEKALRKDPESRYRTALEFDRDLEHWCG